MASVATASSGVVAIVSTTRALPSHAQLRWLEQGPRSCTVGGATRKERQLLCGQVRWSKVLKLRGLIKEGELVARAIWAITEKTPV
jgi:hypothetical protein